MHWKPEIAEGRAESSSTGLDLRHFGAFQQVYRTRDLTEAGHALNTTRKSIRRMMDNLEKAFQCQLFTGTERAPLVPTPFADRLFNDLRFLNSAQQHLEDRIRATHEAGRVLHVGTSPAVFRTSVFRSLFRNLQGLPGIRPSYVPVAPEDNAKAVAGGACDIHIGTKQNTEKRFLTELVTHLNFTAIIRADGPAAAIASSRPSVPAYALKLDGAAVNFDGNGHRALDALPEAIWLRWLEHPEQCPPGTIIYVPDPPSDPTHWALADPAMLPPFKKPLYLTYLKQHPYEFLSSVRNMIQSRFGEK